VLGTQDSAGALQPTRQKTAFFQGLLSPKKKNRAAIAANRRDSPRLSRVRRTRLWGATTLRKKEGSFPAKSPGLLFELHSTLVRTRNCSSRLQTRKKKTLGGRQEQAIWVKKDDCAGRDFKPAPSRNVEEKLGRSRRREAIVMHARGGGRRAGGGFRNQKWERKVASRGVSDPSCSWSEMSGVKEQVSANINPGKTPVEKSISHPSPQTPL